MPKQKKTKREKELEWAIENTRGLIEREKTRYRGKIRMTRQDRDESIRRLKKQVKSAKAQLKQIKNRKKKRREKINEKKIPN